MMAEALNPREDHITGTRTDGAARETLHEFKRDSPSRKSALGNPKERIRQGVHPSITRTHRAVFTGCRLRNCNFLPTRESSDLDESLTGASLALRVAKARLAAPNGTKL